MDKPATTPADLLPAIFDLGRQASEALAAGRYADAEAHATARQALVDRLLALPRPEPSALPPDLTAALVEQHEAFAEGAAAAEQALTDALVEHNRRRQAGAAYGA
jgi:hypothetical protein